MSTTLLPESALEMDVTDLVNLKGKEGCSGIQLYISQRWFESGRLLGYGRILIVLNSNVRLHVIGLPSQNAPKLEKKNFNFS